MADYEFTTTQEEAGEKACLRVAGLMSGTSGDGVDVAIVDIGPGVITLLGFTHFLIPNCCEIRFFDFMI